MLKKVTTKLGKEKGSPSYELEVQTFASLDEYRQAFDAANPEGDSEAAILSIVNYQQNAKAVQASGKDAVRDALAEANGDEKADPVKAAIKAHKAAAKTYVFDGVYRSGGGGLTKTKQKDAVGKGLDNPDFAAKQKALLEEYGLL